MHNDTIKSLSEKSERLVVAWNNTIKPIVSEYVREQATTLQRIRENIETLINKPGKPAEKDLCAFHARNLELLKSLNPNLKSKTEIKDFLNTLKAGLMMDADNLDSIITDSYTNGLGYTEKASLGSKILRKAGDFLFYIENAPLQINNGIAKFRKKQPKPLKERSHNIYYRDIVKGFLINEYILFSLKSVSEVQKKLTHLAHNLFQLEGQIINDNYNTENVKVNPLVIDDINEDIENINDFFKGYKSEFISHLKKSGTTEFPGFYIRFRKKRNVRNIFSQAEETCKQWDSTLYALYEGWRFREELYTFISTIKNQRSEVLNLYTEKLKKTIHPVIAQKRTYLEQLIKQVPEPDLTNNAMLKHFFTSELYKLHKEGNTQSAVGNFSKTGLEIEKLLQKTEVDVNKALEKMSARSGVVRSPDYMNGIDKSDIYFFSPSEFINYKCIPPFFKSIKLSSDNFKEQFQKIIAEFSDFDQIIDFSLDTAISMVNTQSNQEETILMFKEGMKRSLNILDRTTLIGDDILHMRDNDLEGFYVEFIENIKSLDNNDRILSIYSSLIKLKAIEESKNKRGKIFGGLSQVAKSVGSFIKRQYTMLIDSYYSIRKKLKLDKAPVFVSSEISNYLADINTRIYKLPVIYRYLFENAPVKEINLFLSRRKELEKIETALKDWKSGNYAATLVIGENGCGKTSLLQHYIKTIKGSDKIYYYTIHRFYHSEKDFYTLMQDLFDNENLKTEKDVLQHLELLKGNQIIILDGLERAFIRKPGGFECLQKLLSFIVSTNNMALWVCSVSLHACNYLNKTVSIKENFDYMVELNTLDADEVRNIILKRHRLSGYVVHYDDEQNMTPDNKKAKDRQIQLEKEFFMQLNRFSGSNISLSLYFWLESISKFTDKDLFIKKFSTPDFTFLETLSSEKIYTLLLIVLHGKISVDIHASVCNQSTEKSLKVLTILKEDSILILKGNNYMLNGILYRHVIQLLKSKNLIH